jgi:hypothetical protein
MQPHVKTSVSSTRVVAQTSPAGQAPPHRGPSSGPPVLPHGVAVAGRHVQEVVGPGATVAEQLCPAGHTPPQPGNAPHGGPLGIVLDVVVVLGVVVVVVPGVSAAMIAATSACTWLVIALAPPLVGQAPPALDSARAQLASNFVLHLATPGSPPRRAALASARSRQRS